MRFIQLKDVALLQALSVYLRRFIVKEEVPKVNDTARIETLDHKPQSLKEYEDFNHPLFNHLDCIHLIARLEDQLAWVVLSAPDGIDKFVKDHGRDPFFQEVYLLKHA